MSLFRVLPISTLLGAALLLAGSVDGTEAPATNEFDNSTSVNIQYSGRIFGIRVLKTTVSAAFVGESYAAKADFRTSGLIAFFKQVKVTAGTSGDFRDGKLFTKKYWHKELDGRKNRALSLEYLPDEVSIRVDPPLHTMGDPAATMEQRLEAVDPISGILALALKAGSDERAQQCVGRIKIFDGKQRYNLRLQAMGLERVRTKAYKGQALRCNAWYEPIAGFDADDLADPDQYKKPIVMWLADEKQGGMRLPVRFQAKLDFGNAVVEARKINISTKP